jgi:hypothetical protein
MEKNIYTSVTEYGLTQYHLDYIYKEASRFPRVFFRFPEHGSEWLEGTFSTANDGSPAIDISAPLHEQERYAAQGLTAIKEGGIRIDLPKDTPIKEEYRASWYEGHESLGESGIPFLADAKVREHFYDLAEALGIESIIFNDGESVKWTGTAAASELHDFLSSIELAGHGAEADNTKELPKPVVTQGKITGRDLEKLIEKKSFDLIALKEKIKSTEDQEEVSWEKERAHVMQAIKEDFLPALGGELKTSNILLTGETGYYYIDPGLTHARTVEIVFGEQSIPGLLSEGWHYQYVSDLDARLESRAFAAEANISSYSGPQTSKSGDDGLEITFSEEELEGKKQDQVLFPAELNIADLNTVKFRPAGPLVSGEKADIEPKQRILYCDKGSGTKLAGIVREVNEKKLKLDVEGLPFALPFVLTREKGYILTLKQRQESKAKMVAEKIYQEFHPGR